jgi:hypothetical protein
MNVVYLVFGLLLLLAGRRLYWLFVAAMGFGVGMVLAQGFLRPEGLAGATDGREWGMLIAVLGGIVGALLAVFFQKLAVALAGAAAGGFAGWVLFEALIGGSLAWIGMALGAVLGAILVLWLFDWGLIFFSSLGGAKLIVIDGLRIDPSQGALLFLAAFAIGMVLQGLQLVRSRQKRVPSEDRRSRTPQRKE